MVLRWVATHSPVDPIQCKAEREHEFTDSCSSLDLNSEFCSLWRRSCNQPNIWGMSRFPFRGHPETFILHISPDPQDQCNVGSLYKQNIVIRVTWSEQWHLVSNPGEGLVWLFSILCLFMKCKGLWLILNIQHAWTENSSTCQGHACTLTFCVTPHFTQLELLCPVLSLL